MTNTNAAGFIVTDGTLVWGFGPTQADANSHALDSLQAAQINLLEDDDDTEQHGSFMRRSSLITHPATAALMQDFEERGGAIAWAFNGSTACTLDEEPQT